jgi:intracellular multiplication protein IcmB
MLSAISRAFAGLSLALKQPLESFCDLETAHGNALVTKQGNYLSFLRLDGMRRMATRADVERIATAMRIDLSGSLENRGHAIVGWYASDPDLSAVEIGRVNMDSCRAVARELGLDLADILDERMALWPRIMRWEAGYCVLWTRKAVLTKEERAQMREEQAALAQSCPGIGGAQRFYMRSEVMAARHAAFVLRVLSAFKAQDIAATEIDPHAALTVVRESFYRETVGSDWKAVLPGDRVMARLPDEDVGQPSKEGLLWPRLAEQIFHRDAETEGGQRVAIGENDYAGVDLAAPRIRGPSSNWQPCSGRTASPGAVPC